MKRQPISKFEKFVEGLTKLLVLQPSAQIEIIEGRFFVGDTTDPFLSRGIKDYLTNMGFYIEEGKFVFEIKKEKSYAKY